MKHTALILTSAFALSTVATQAATPVNWPQFRGGKAGGVADGSTLPTQWSAKENVAWAAEIPGNGWSSPIVWQDTVILTSAVNTGKFKAPSTGIFGNDYAAELKAAGHSDEEILKRITARDIELTKEAEEVSYRVLALDSKTGKVKWQHEAYKGLPPGGRHRKNTYASETPATDGERIYASFGGNVGLFCYTMEGKQLWKKTWPPQPIYLDFGTASSPVVHNGRVYQMHDNEGESFLVALDAKTGEEVFKTSRSGFKARSQSGWATPFIWENGARTEVITIGKGLVISYGTDGKEIWRLGGMTQATPSPIAGEGLLFVGSGSQGETNRPLFAVKPGATGDLTTAKDAPLNEHVSWFLPRFSAYTSSPLLYRGRVYAVNDNGILQVADAKTGKEIYKSRVGTGSATFSSSPLASDGKVYLLSEDGDMYVVAAGDEYKEVAKNSLGEMSLATPAADAESIYVRTATKLYRMKGKAKS